MEHKPVEKQVEQSYVMIQALENGVTIFGLTHGARYEISSHREA